MDRIRSGEETGGWKGGEEGGTRWGEGSCLQHFSLVHNHMHLHNNL